MPDIQSARSGFIGLDLHSHYVVIVGVDSEGHQALGPRRIRWTNFQGWAQQHLTPQDAVVLEMTTNALTVYDEISPQVHSVTVVDPPNVALVARARGKTDRKAALILAQLHAAGLPFPMYNGGSANLSPHGAGSRRCLRQPLWQGPGGGCPRHDGDRLFYVSLCRLVRLTLYGCQVSSVLTRA